MPSRCVFLIERQSWTEHDGTRRAQFFVRPGSRSGKWRWFKDHEVPEFEGEAAAFECERDGRRWKVIRQIDK